LTCHASSLFAELEYESVFTVHTYKNVARIIDFALLWGSLTLAPITPLINRGLAICSIISKFLG